MSFPILKFSARLIQSSLSYSRPILKVKCHSRNTTWVPLFQQQRRRLSADQQAAAPDKEAPSIKDKLPKPEKAPARLREFDLQDKVFVVTGGARGLGLTLAEALVEAGGKGEALLRHSTTYYKTRSSHG